MRPNQSRICEVCVKVKKEKGLGQEVLCFLLSYKFLLAKLWNSRSQNIRRKYNVGRKKIAVAYSCRNVQHSSQVNRALASRTSILNSEPSGILSNQQNQKMGKEVFALSSGVSFIKKKKNTVDWLILKMYQQCQGFQNNCLTYAQTQHAHMRTRTHAQIHIQSSLFTDLGQHRQQQYKPPTHATQPMYFTPNLQKPHCSVALAHSV